MFILVFIQTVRLSFILVYGGFDGPQSIGLKQVQTLQVTLSGDLNL